MVQVPNKTMALEEFLKLPETEPASEFINGQIIQKPMPQGKHSLTQGELISTINRVVRPKKLRWLFQNCAAPLAENPLFQIFPFLPGKEFQLTKQEELRTFSKLALIG
jgi:hypothetical protein